MGYAKANGLDNNLYNINVIMQLKITIMNNILINTEYNKLYSAITEALKITSYSLTGRCGVEVCFYIPLCES